VIYRKTKQALKGRKHQHNNKTTFWLSPFQGDILPAILALGVAQYYCLGPFRALEQIIIKN
jgi:hypothetical protein